MTFIVFVTFVPSFCLAFAPAAAQIIFMIGFTSHQSPVYEHIAAVFIHDSAESMAKIVMVLQKATDICLFEELHAVTTNPNFAASIQSFSQNLFSGVIKDDFLCHVSLHQDGGTDVCGNVTEVHSGIHWNLV